MLIDRSLLTFLSGKCRELTLNLAFVWDTLGPIMSLLDLQGGKKLGHLIHFSLSNTRMDEIRVEHTHNSGGCSLLCVGMIDHVSHPIMAMWLSSRFNDDKRDLISTRSWTECPQVIHTREYTSLSIYTYMMPTPCSR